MEIDLHTVSTVVGGLILACFTTYYKVRAIITKNTNRVSEQLEGIHQLMKVNVERTKSQISGLDPNTYFTLDLMLENGIPINYPLIPLQPIMIFPGLSMILLRSDTVESVVMMYCDPSVLIRLPVHSHKSIERIEIIDGSIWDRQGKKRYHKNEVWDIPAGELHAGDLDGCIAVVRYIPPLSLASHRPVNLDGIDTIFRSFLEK